MKSPKTQDYSSCIICGKNLSNTSPRTVENHVNECLDRTDQKFAKDLEQPVQMCIVCDKNLDGFNENQRQLHINRCLDRSSNKDSFSPIKRKHSSALDSDDFEQENRFINMNNHNISKKQKKKEKKDLSKAMELSLREAARNKKTSKVRIDASDLLTTEDAKIGLLERICRQYEVDYETSSWFDAASGKDIEGFDSYIMENLDCSFQVRICRTSCM